MAMASNSRRAGYQFAPDEKPSTSLQRLCDAVYEKSCATVEVLLHHKADVNEAEPVRGTTALHVACVLAVNGEMDVIKCLIDNGADLYARTTKDRPAPDHEGPWEKKHRSRAEVVKILFENAPRKPVAPSMSPFMAFTAVARLLDKLLEEGGINNDRVLGLLHRAGLLPPGEPGQDPDGLSEASRQWVDSRE